MYSRLRYFYFYSFILLIANPYFIQARRGDIIATLEELCPWIDKGKEAVLILPHDHPGNKEKRDLKIRVSQVRQGHDLCKRILEHRDEDSWSSLVGATTLTWKELLEGSSGVEATSDEWYISA
jgi:hypothetical protein